jgi:hypothetical protein
MSDFNTDPYPPRWLFVVVAIVGIVLAGVILFAASPSKGAQPAPCMDTEMRERVRMLMLSGIDQGFRAHAQHMFEVWQKDPTKQPARANAGMRSGITAYIGARAAAQRWSPPACP